MIKMNEMIFHFDQFKDIISKIQELKKTQVRFLASQTVFEDNSNDYNVQSDEQYTPIKLKRMSVNKSLRQTGNIYKAKESDNIKSCIICFQPYTKNELIRKLKCTHQFHKKCIDKWFYPKYHEDEELACPLCRQDALPLSFTPE